MEDIISIADINNTRMGMGVRRHFRHIRGSTAATHPWLLGLSSLHPALSRSSGGAASEGAVWPPSRGVPGPPAWHGGGGSPSLAPRTWPHPGPLGQERAGEGKAGGGGCLRIRAGGLSLPPGIGEGGKRAARRQRCPRTGPREWGRQSRVGKGPRGTPDARCSTP